jgi:hypothetical protein
MSEITEDLLHGKSGNSPLVTYPWQECAEQLILWGKDKSPTHRAFIFDVLMSLAYIDTIPNIQKNLKVYDDLYKQYNAYLGFTNLCVPLLLRKNEWHFQKAAKPQSGSIGKLTSEIILKCTEIYFDDFSKVQSIGGSGLIDAVLFHQDGRIILGEIKASPLTTFPFLFNIPSGTKQPEQLTRTQVESYDSALFMHCDEIIPLGKPTDDLWPFLPLANFFLNSENTSTINKFIKIWDSIRNAYRDKDRDSYFYYIANASGHPPKIAKDQYNWPSKESISDAKTSAGLDRTDDIKKGIYQTFKLSIESHKEFPNQNIKIALISNLPAYRHGSDYIEPFYDIYWGQESSFIEESEELLSCQKSDLKRPFDYIIALDDAYTRGELI